MNAGVIWPRRAGTTLKTILRCATLLAGLTQIVGSVAFAQEVIPDFYKDPGMYPNRDYVNQHISEHIDPFTGALQIHATDIHLPGNGGFDLSVIRSYNSSSINTVSPSDYTSLAGLGWTIHFGRVLKAGDANICQNTKQDSVADNPVLELPDGSRQLLYFGTSASPLMITTQRWKAECIGAGNGLAVYSPNGIRYDMTQSTLESGGTRSVYGWYTTKITDRNANTATISYSATSSPQISSVSTSDGRTLSFSYLDSGTEARRISSITGAGRTWSYSYTAVSGVLNRYFLTTVTRPGSTTWNYSYNGKLTTPGSYLMQSMTYPQGGRISYSYGTVYFDTQANASSESTVVKTKSTSDGGSWSFSYTPGGAGSYDKTTVTSPTGTVTYQHIGANYSSSGTVWQVGLLMRKDIGGVQSETYTWDKQLISNENNFRPGAFVTKVDADTYAPVLTNHTIVRNASTHSTSYSSFDSYGNPATVTESGPNGGSRTTSLTYYTDTSKWIVKQVQNESFTGRSINRTFDANGNLYTETVDGAKTTYGRYSSGDISDITNPRNFKTTYSSYKRGIATGEIHPESVTITRVVDDAGNVTSETNGEAKTYQYGYDGLNRITSVTYPTGSPVSVIYTSTSKTATRGGFTEAVNYDGFGRPSSITRGGITTSYRWDSSGRKTFESYPGSGNGTSYGYDILNRVTSMGNPDGTAKSISYGASSTTITDERSNATTYSYRAYGDPEKQFLMTITPPVAGTAITIARNVRDLPTSVTQNSISRTYGYNSQYFLTSAIHPETGTTTYGRDSMGNMTSKSVGSSGTTSYTYDGLNRLTNITYPGTTPGVSKTYSKTNKLKTITSSAATRTLDYDSNDNLQTETLVVDGLTFTANYGYDGLDHLSTITYPRSGKVVAYAPNALGRPTQATPYITGATYWPSGQVNTLTRANGVTDTYNQNNRLWPSTFNAAKNGTSYVNNSYTFDGTGNLTAISDNIDSSYNRTLTYDNVNRLSTASGPWGTGSIDYSPDGNISKQTFGTATLNYTYSSGKLSSVSGTRTSSYTYDSYGNITAGNGSTYTYNDAPNMTCANCADSANRIDYVYDGQNTRVSSTKGGVKTYEFTSVTGNLLSEYTPSKSNQLIEYAYIGSKRVGQRTADDLAATVTTLTSSANPTKPGTAISYTAKVTGTNNPTGNVTFYDGSTALGTVALNAGQASYAITYSTPGSHTISARYLGNTGNGTSLSGVLTQQVKYSTSTTLSVSSNPLTVGQTLTLNASVIGSGTGSYAPTGNVVFKNGASILAIVALTNQSATLYTQSLPIGSNPLSAEYSGDGNNSSSISPTVNQSIIDKATPVLDIAIPPRIKLNQVLKNLQIIVSGNQPSGQVVLKDSGIIIGSATLIYNSNTKQSTASIASLSFGTLGPRLLTLEYPGDAFNKAASLNVGITVVNQLPGIGGVLYLLQD